MISRPRVLVVQPEGVCPVGMVGLWLAEAGVDCDVLAAEKGRALPAVLGDAAGLIVMGGRMGADDDVDHRWMVPTKALIIGTVAARAPFLGICLGHQLAASALGGEVRRNEHGPTVGLVPWSPSEEGRADELTEALAPGTPMFHHNNDVVTRLPARAVALAHTPDGHVQAARYGPRAWGVQFHPEVTPDVASGWGQGPEDTQSLQAATALREREAELHRGWEPLARRFARIVRGG
ncbi:type 1 glutamine amidotransferase [Ornithinimicrobium sp. Y1847]|uniref:type 1 glutamine amidotransferase n=1 Tax=unclassified Ornithinimicrobium TaxID=2615080 RepID=UPI003B67C3E7